MGKGGGMDGWVRGEGVCVRVGRGWGMDGWPSSRLGGWWWCLRIESWDLKLLKKEIVCDFVLVRFSFYVCGGFGYKSLFLGC